METEKTRAPLAGTLDQNAAASLVVGRDVETVVIDGKVVMKNREVLTVDVEQIKARLARRQPELMGRFEALVA